METFLRTALIWGTALGAFCGAISLQASRAEEVQLEWQPKGVSSKAGYYQPARLELSDKQPESIKKLPEGVEKLKFGTFQFGAVETPFNVVAALFEPKRGEGKLWLDANGNGDLTDDPAIAWKARSSKRGELELFQFNGSASVAIRYGEEQRAFNISFYRFDPEDPARKGFANALFYYRDSGYSER